MCPTSKTTAPVLYLIFAAVLNLSIFLPSSEKSESPLQCFRQSEVLFFLAGFHCVPRGLFSLFTWRRKRLNFFYKSATTSTYSLTGVNFLWRYPPACQPRKKNFEMPMCVTKKCIAMIAFMTIGRRSSNNKNFICFSYFKQLYSTFFSLRTNLLKFLKYFIYCCTSVSHPFPFVWSTSLNNKNM